MVTEAQLFYWPFTFFLAISKKATKKDLEQMERKLGLFLREFIDTDRKDFFNFNLVSFFL